LLRRERLLLAGEGRQGQRRLLRLKASSAAVAAAVAAGMEGAGSGDRWKAEVNSPNVLRRQALMLVSVIPVTRSMKRSTEVWSSGSVQTKPPTDQGEMTKAGTRNPDPRLSPPPGVPPGELSDTNPSAVPFGGTIGDTWSKNPSYSS
jgi:hypothetical protein